MLEIFSTLLTGVLSGGATGLFGVLIQRYFDVKAKAQEIEIVAMNHANSLKLAELESARAAVRAEADMAITDRKAEADEAVADYEGLKAAMEADKATYLNPAAQTRPGKVGSIVVLLMGFTDALRGLVRPSLTLYLCGLVTVMFFWVRDLAEKHSVTLTPMQIHDLMLQIVTSILYVFTVCTLFWFGTRGTSKR